MVSGITSTVKEEDENSVTVRHTPSILMLSPTFSPSRTLFAETDILAVLPAVLILLMIPFSSIIPVNMSI
jgi:hypothetical protein